MQKSKSSKSKSRYTAHALTPRVKIDAIGIEGVEMHYAGSSNTLRATTQDTMHRDPTSFNELSRHCAMA